MKLNLIIKNMMFQNISSQLQIKKFTKKMKVNSFTKMLFKTSIRIENFKILNNSLKA